MTAYKMIEMQLMKLTSQIHAMTQDNYELRMQNQKLQKLVDAYKAKSDLLIERVRPHDYDMWPGDEELLKDSEQE